MINWAIIGCGNIAKKSVAPAINENKNSLLVAVMRRNKEKARDFASKYKAKKYYTDLKNLLKDKEIDAVYIATPVYLHSQQTILAAKTGKHILCEKPMALNISQCKEMIKVCKDNRVNLGIAYYRRFYPKMQKIKELLKENKIGKPLIVKIQHYTYYNPSSDDPRAWRMNQEKSGGGVLMDIGSHRLDLLLYLFGIPEEITALSDRIVLPYPVEDTISVLIKFKKYTEAIVNFSWGIKNKVDDLEIYGTKGKIIASPLNEDKLSWYNSDDKLEKEFHLPRGHNTHLPLIENFVASIEDRSKPLITGEDGIKVNLMMEAIYKSAKTKRRIKIDEEQF